MNAWPYYAPDEIEAVNRVLTSGRVNYWTGDEVRRFENEFASYLGTPHAVALANGTLALEGALLALGVGPGDEVVVPPRTFVATAGVVALRGARPVFADIDRDSGNVTAATIEPCLTPRTRAIMLVHLGGRPCEMDAILDLARSRDLPVIEDCAQAVGARYRGRPVGTLGRVGAFSFCQDKIISTGGEGGMLTTADPEVWRTVWSHKDHGKDYEECHRQEEASFHWLHHSFGSNWRLTEMQAAIGRVQLTKLNGWVERRRHNAQLLAAAWADLPLLRLPLPADHLHPAWYRLYAYVRPERLREGWTRGRILAEFRARGIPGLTGSCCEIYNERAFAAAGLQPAERLPVARELAETVIAFPLHPTLSQERLEEWATVAREVLTGATR